MASSITADLNTKNVPPTPVIRYTFGGVHPWLSSRYRRTATFDYLRKFWATDTNAYDVVKEKQQQGHLSINEAAFLERIENGICRGKRIYREDTKTYKMWHSKIKTDCDKKRTFNQLSK
jgi:hypothetical protein